MAREALNSAAVSSVDIWVTLLRQEAEECAEILKTVQHHKENLMAGASDKIWQTSENIERKIRALGVTRQQREMAQQNAAAVLRTEPAFKEMIPKLTAQVGGEALGLVHEIERRRQAIKRVAEENQKLIEDWVATQELNREVQLQQALQKL